MMMIVLEDNGDYNKNLWVIQGYAEFVLGFRPANERHHYKVMPSLIGWTKTSDIGAIRVIDYTPQRLWNAITYPCPRYLVIAQFSFLH